MLEISQYLISKVHCRASDKTARFWHKKRQTYWSTEHNRGSRSKAPQRRTANMTRLPQTHAATKTVYQKSVLQAKLGIYIQKYEIWSKSGTKMNSKWMKGFNLEPEMLILLEKNISRQSHGQKLSEQDLIAQQIAFVGLHGIMKLLHSEANYQQSEQIDTEWEKMC